MKKLILLLIGIFLFSLVSAGSCSQSGYQYCWEETNTYGDATSNAKIYWQFEDDNGIVVPNNNAISNLYIKAGWEGTDHTVAYGIYNAPSWENIEGRIFADSQNNFIMNQYNIPLLNVGNGGKTKIASQGETFTKCLALVAIDTKHTDYYSWVYAGYGWIGSGDCLNIKVIAPCTPNCDCSFNTPVGQTCSDGCEGLCPGSQVCTENWQCGDWSSCIGNQQTRTCTDLNSCGATSAKPMESQSCITPVCDEGETKNYVCPDNSEVKWCDCINNEWACAISPETSCKKDYTWLIILVIFIGVIGILVYFYKRRKR